eukprot:scaffold463_cov46-Attheya_sp.AAC.3
MPPRKRACTAGKPRPTLRDLVVGSRLIEATQTLTPCIVFGDEFSSWLSCLGGLGFRATALVLKSPKFVDLAQSLVDTSCQIHVGIDSKFSNTSSQIAFIDGRLTQGRLQVIQDLGLTTFVATRGLRRPLPGWVSKSTNILHSSVGGVTIKQVGVTVCSLTPNFFCPVPSSNDVVLHDASTIMDSKGHSLFYRPAPMDIHLTPLRCETLGTSSCPFIHGGGLLPAYVSLKTRVITPTLFAPKGTWGIRRLSGNELLLAHDWPMFLIDAVSDACKVFPPLLPGKCLVAGLCQLLGNGGGLLGCGLVKQRSAAKRRRHLDDTDNVWGKIKGGIPIDSVLSTIDGTAFYKSLGFFHNFRIFNDPNTETDDGSGAKSDVPSSGSKQGTAANPETEERIDNTRSQSNVKDQNRELKSLQTSCGHGLTSGKDDDYKAEAPSPGSKQGSDANPETEEESNNTHSKISGSEPGVAACSESEKNITRTNLKAASFLGGTTDDKLLEAIDREKRERKATKSDDAEVPVYLWEEYMINDGDFGRTTADLPRMRPLMGACRVPMLKWWKRKVTSSLFSW